MKTFRVLLALALFLCSSTVAAGPAFWTNAGAGGGGGGGADGGVTGDGVQGYVPYWTDPTPSHILGTTPIEYNNVNNYVNINLTGTAALPALSLGPTNAVGFYVPAAGGLAVTLGSGLERMRWAGPPGQDSVIINGGTLLTGLNAVSATTVLPNSNTTIFQYGYEWTATSTGSGTDIPTGSAFFLNAGYTGNVASIAAYASNVALGTTGALNVGFYGSTTGTGVTTGTNIGTFGIASGSSVMNIGAYGRATSTVGTAGNIGVMGYSNQGASNSPRIGVYATNDGTGNTFTHLSSTNAALVADCGASAQDIMNAFSNTAQVFQITNFGVVDINVATHGTTETMQTWNVADATNNASANMVNASGTAATNNPRLSFFHGGASAAMTPGIQSMATAGNDTGTAAMITLMASRSTSFLVPTADLTTRPILSIDNNATIYAQMGATGVWTNQSSTACGTGDTGAWCFGETTVKNRNTGGVFFTSQYTASSTTAQSGFIAQDNAGTAVFATAFADTAFTDVDYANKGYILGVSKIIMLARSDNVAAGTAAFEFRDNTSATGNLIGMMDGEGSFITQSFAAAGSNYHSVRGGDTAAYAYFQALNSAGTITAQFGYGGTTAGDADYQDKFFIVGVSKLIMEGRTDNVAAGTIGWEWRDDLNGTGAQVAGIYGDGKMKNGTEYTLSGVAGFTPTLLAAAPQTYAGYRNANQGLTITAISASVSVAGVGTGGNWQITDGTNTCNCAITCTSTGSTSTTCANGAGTGCTYAANAALDMTWQADCSVTNPTIRNANMLAKFN